MNQRLRLTVLAAATIVVAAGCEVNLPHNDTNSKCWVYDRGKWNASNLTESYVQQPKCPVIFNYNDFPEGYAINIIAGDLTKIQPAPAPVYMSFLITALPRFSPTSGTRM